MTARAAADGAAVALDERDRRHIAGRERLRAPLVYEIVRAEGTRELERPAASLFWSGFAAGLSIALSLLAESYLQAHLPEAPWRHVVASFGYSAGFVVVVLGRQQLFTENTITAVLPVMARPSRPALAGMARLWSLVLVSNILGTIAVAALLANAPLFEPEVFEAMQAVAHHFLALTAGEMFWRGILAGWLIATMVWLLPSAGSSALWVVILSTWLIALGELSHVIAGAVEASFLLFLGQTSLATAIFAFFLPTLAGNIVGGSALFALVSYAQVRREMKRPDK